METLTRKLSNGIVMTLRCPADSTKSPAIILCHGFCGIRETLLPSFAEELFLTSLPFLSLGTEYILLTPAPENNSGGHHIWYVWYS